VVAAALLAAWAIWQPLRAADGVSRAQDALSAGHSSAALGDARRAASEDPVSPAPLWTEAQVYSAAGELGKARGALIEAVSLEPQNPATWRELGQFDQTHHLGAQLAADLSHIRLLDRADPGLVETYVRGGG
jgi:predicted Zn-dependent protease